MLPQSLAGRLCAIDTEADGVVVIDLEVTETVVTQEMDHLFREVIEGERVAEVPVAAAADLKHPTIPLEMVIGEIECL